MHRVLLAVLFVAGCSTKGSGSVADGQTADRPAQIHQTEQPEANLAGDPTKNVPEQGEPPVSDDGDAASDPERPQARLACSPASGDNPSAICNPAYECENDVVYEVDCEAEGPSDMRCRCMDGEEIASFTLARGKCDDLLSTEGVSAHCKLPVHLFEA
jgi:hypothetical protein